MHLRYFRLFFNRVTSKRSSGIKVISVEYTLIKQIILVIIKYLITFHFYN
jgi:hypothetical protein